jgi:hypothetical protein
MQTCPKCATVNRDGLLICEKCGHNMTGTVSFSTRQMPIPRDLVAEIAAVKPVTGRLYQPGKIILQLRGSFKPLVLEGKNQFIIGRMGNHTVRRPDLDLSPYNAFRLGVSCFHATLYRVDQAVYIADMGSLNGTYINGAGILPHERHSLRCGDLLHLGQLAARIFF